MALRYGSTLTRVALASGLSSVLSVVAFAQFGAGPPQPPYTPPEGAKDLKSVLVNWPWHMGMLRGIEEHDGRDFLVVGTLLPPTVNVISHNQVIAFSEMVDRLKRISAVGEEPPTIR